MRTEVREYSLREKPSLYAQVVLGLAPHYWQALWMDCLAPTKVGCMGRSFGKTFGEAASLLWFADCHDETEQLIVAPTSDQTRTILRYAKQMIADGSLHVQSRVDRIADSPFPEISWRNGSRIMARPAGNDGSNLRSLHPDVVRYDECAFIPSLVVDEVVPPMIATSPYQWTIAISTPWGKNHFFDMFRDATPYEMGTTADAVAFQLPSRLNPAITAGFLAREREKRTDLAFRVEYLAEFAEDQNAVFPHTLIQSCIDPELDLKAALRTPPDPTHRFVLGYDPAKWQDRSGVVALDITSTPWRVADVLDISGRDYLIQAAEIKRLTERYGNAPVLMDSTSHDQMLEQLRADHVKAEGFKFTNESKQELINGLVIAMEQGKLRIPNHRDLINELTYYRYELTAAGNVRLGADANHHDDLVTALALAVRATSGPDLPYAYLRNDPEFRTEVLGAIAADTETSEDRIARRRAALGL